MLYLFESEVPDNKSLLFALTYIFGIGKGSSILICKNLGFSNNLKVKDLSKEQIHKLLKFIEIMDIKIVSDLKKVQLLISQRLVFIKSYRGLRKNRGLPIRGQRTHTNAKTARKRY